MKKLLLMLIILFPISSFAVNVFAGTYENMAKELLSKIPAKEQTKTIAVMPFSSDAEFASDARIAMEEMTKALINAGANVSERSQIDKLLKEQELQQVGVLTNENAGEIGQGVGAKYVVLGTVTKIDKYGEQGNIGLKINVKLVVSANYKVIAASSGEAAAGDASSKYKRQAPKKASEYPQFLELFGGATFFNYNGEYDDGTLKDDRTMGFSGGARFLHSSKGFFTSGYEFLFSTRTFDDDSNIKKINTYQLSWVPTVRIPLWSYMPALPDYTSIHIAYAIGAGLNNATYLEDDEDTSSYGIGICSSAIVGLRLGLTDAVSIFGDFRYTPSFLNGYVRSQKIDNDDVALNEKMTGPAFYFGISIAP